MEIVLLILVVAVPLFIVSMINGLNDKVRRAECDASEHPKTISFGQ